MTGIYGHRWVSSFGEAVSETWVRGLMDLTGEELARGLRGCLARSESMKRAGDEDWPPTLGEFRILSRPVRPACHDPLPSLPKPMLTDEQRREIDADIERLRQETRAAGVRADAEDKYRRLARTHTREPGEDG